MNDVLLNPTDQQESRRAVLIRRWAKAAVAAPDGTAYDAASTRALDAAGKVGTPERAAMGIAIAAAERALATVGALRIPTD